MGERARSLTAEQGDRGEAQLLAGDVLSCLWAAHPSLSPPGSTGSKREPGSGLRQQQQGSSSGVTTSAPPGDLPHPQTPPHGEGHSRVPKGDIPVGEGGDRDSLPRITSPWKL